MIAGLNPSVYGEIYELSRLLVSTSPIYARLDRNLTKQQVFYGCPHQAKSGTDMEEQLLRFLYINQGKHKLPPVLFSIHKVANAILETNSAYMDSKHMLFSDIMNVYVAQGINVSSYRSPF